MTGVADRVLVRLYTDVIRIRAFEEKIIGLFRQGAISGFTHSCIGQEASAAGVCAALLPTDWISTNHRGHGHVLAKGADPREMFSEVFGTADGLCRGMGGETHLMDMDHGILGSNGIVGGGIPIAVGAALADQLAGRDSVSVAFFGDGATSGGYFSESMNLAAIWDLPVVFVCENNRYGLFTPAVDVVSGRIRERAIGYGIPGVDVDGQEAAAVYQVAAEAVERARSGGGPTLIEASTYRFHGHVYGEEALIGDHRYRTVQEVEEFRTRRDPVALAAEACLAAGAATKANIARIESEARAEMDLAADRAAEGEPPPVEQALDFIFAQPGPPARPAGVG